MVVNVVMLKQAAKQQSPLEKNKEGNHAQHQEKEFARWMESGVPSPTVSLGKRDALQTPSPSVRQSVYILYNNVRIVNERQWPYRIFFSGFHAGGGNRVALWAGMVAVKPAAQAEVLAATAHVSE